MILIAGGAGYIGSHINKLLNKRGYKTIVIDNLVYGHREFVKWGEFYEIDLLDKNKLEDIFARNRIDAVMHFAAYTYVGESVSNPSKYYNNNLKSTLNLLDVMLKYNVKKIIFSSTCAVYGFPEKIPLVETHPQNPLNPYGRTKLFIEKMLEDYEKAYGINYVSLRYFNASGADMDLEIGEWHNPETHLIPLAIYNALGITDEITIFGSDYNTSDGTCIRDYIYVEDIANAHLLSLEYLNSGGKSDVFNLANTKGFSVMEIINVVEKISGRKLNVVYGKRRSGDSDVLIGSFEKAKKIIGWNPVVSQIDKIIETAFLWHKKNKDKIMEELCRKKA